jgi:hypothetical protein
MARAGAGWQAGGSAPRFLRCAACGDWLAVDGVESLRQQAPEDPWGPPQTVHISCWLQWRTAQDARRSA